MQEVLVGLLISGITIGFAAAFCVLTQRKLHAMMRQAFRDAQPAVTLPVEFQTADLDTNSLEDIGFRVSRTMLWRKSIAGWMVDFAFVLIPLVVAFSVAIAVIGGRVG